MAIASPSCCLYVELIWSVLRVGKEKKEGNWWIEYLSVRYRKPHKVEYLVLTERNVNVEGESALTSLHSVQRLLRDGLSQLASKS